MAKLKRFQFCLKSWKTTSLCLESNCRLRVSFHLNMKVFLHEDQNLCWKYVSFRQNWQEWSRLSEKNEYDAYFLHFFRPRTTSLFVILEIFVNLKSKEKTRHVQNISINKKSTIFVRSSWNLVEMIISWGNYFDQVS